MAKPEKLTMVLESELRNAVEAWAREEGRPVSNLLRRIVDKACAQHRQQQPAQAA
jgi:hypothetical protein